MARIVSHVSLSSLPEADKMDKPLQPRKGRELTASGYGRRVPTRHMIRHDGRWRRVYCCIFSNAGTCYIEQGKDWIVVTD